MEQRSQEWFNARLGRFTASQISKLLGKKGFGATGETYIFERAAEILTGQPIEIQENYAMKRGTELEPYAKKWYEKSFEVEIKEAGFIEFGKYAGASPDGIVNENYGIEIKCPNNPANHVRNLLMKSENDLKDNFPEYYYQIQMCMLATGLNNWEFISFHPDFNGMNRMLVLPVKRNESDIILIQTRIKEASEILEKILTQINLE